MLNMQYVSAQMNIIYDPVENVRQYSEMIANKLKPYFSSGMQNLPVQEFVPVDVPVVMGVNQEENSIIDISATRIHIVRNARQECAIDVESFVDFCYDVYSITDIVDRKNQILYCGITLLGVIPYENANTYLANKFQKIRSEKKLYDIYTKLTFVEEDRYYVNITLSNIREGKDKSNGIRVEIDINDRYRFNFNKQVEPYSSSDILEILEGKLYYIIQDKIEALIIEGKY